MIQGMTVGFSRVPGLHVSKNRTILRLLVLTHYQRVTDRRTDTAGHDNNE